VDCLKLSYDVMRTINRFISSQELLIYNNYVHNLGASSETNLGLLLEMDLVPITSPITLNLATLRAKNTSSNMYYELTCYTTVYVSNGVVHGILFNVSSSAMFSKIVLFLNGILLMRKMSGQYTPNDSRYDFIVMTPDSEPSIKFGNIYYPIPLASDKFIFALNPEISYQSDSDVLHIGNISGVTII